jgi:hypothetical protein
MGKTILVDDCFVERQTMCSTSKIYSTLTELRKTECKICKTYLTIIELLTERFNLGDSDVLTVKKYNALPGQAKQDLWRSLCAICLHANSIGYTSLLIKACEKTVPVIMVREERMDTDVWTNAFQQAGWEDLKPSELGSTGKLFYMVDEADDVRGAVRWITDYYPRLKKTIAIKVRDEMTRSTIKAMGEIQGYMMETVAS